MDACDIPSRALRIWSRRYGYALAPASIWPLILVWKAALYRLMIEFPDGPELDWPPDGCGGSEMKNENPNMAATLLTLPEIFQGRLFSIPDYQRGYAWDKDQVTALHEDIEHLFDAEGHLHFTGTVVLTRNHQDQRNGHGVGEVYDIIDGQQRLTTMFILLRELIERLEDGNHKAKLLDLYIKRGKEGNATPVFKLNSQIDPYFRAYIIQGQSEPKAIEYFSEQRIQMSKKLSGEWLCKMINEKGKSAEELISIITEKFGFILYLPENDAEAGMMFEVINNRGKPLTELEKVKNYLIYYAIKENKSELRHAVDQCWGEMLKNLASAHQLHKADENTFLRAVSVVFLGLNKNQASDVYKELKSRYPVHGNEDAWRQLLAFVKFMRACSFYYDTLLNEQSAYRSDLKEEARIYIEQLRSQTSYANILPVYFAVMDKRDNISSQQFIDILRMLEVFNFRVYMARNGAGRTDTGQGALYAMARGYFSSFESDKWLNYWRAEDDFHYKDNVSLLISRLLALIEHYNSDSRFKSGLVLDKDENYDFFKWGGIRYFLMNYERKINHKRLIKIDKIRQPRQQNASNEFLSVEHIWARENTAGESVGNHEGKFEKRRLGNFILLELGINIQAQQKGIDEKVKIYSGINRDQDKSQLKQVDFVIADFQKVKKQLDSKYTKKRCPGYMVQMHKRVIDMNEERLIDFAVKRWATDWAVDYKPDVTK